MTNLAFNILARNLIRFEPGHYTRRGLLREDGEYGGAGPACQGRRRSGVVRSSVTFHSLSSAGDVAPFPPRWPTGRPSIPRGGRLGPRGSAFGSCRRGTLVDRSRPALSNPPWAVDRWSDGVGSNGDLSGCSLSVLRVDEPGGALSPRPSCWPPATVQWVVFWVPPSLVVAPSKE